MGFWVVVLATPAVAKAEDHLAIHCNRRYNYRCDHMAAQYGGGLVGVGKTQASLCLLRSTRGYFSTYFFFPFLVRLPQSTRSPSPR